MIICKYRPQRGRIPGDATRAECIEGAVALILILAALLTLGGCASAPVWIPPSYPQPLMSAADVVGQVAPYVAPEAVLRCEGLRGEEKKVCRDTFLDAVLLGADANWREYEALLFDGAQKAAQPSTFDKVTTLVGLGVGVAAAQLHRPQPQRQHPRRRRRLFPRPHRPHQRLRPPQRQQLRLVQR